MILEMRSALLFVLSLCGFPRESAAFAPISRAHFVGSQVPAACDAVVASHAGWHQHQIKQRIGAETSTALYAAGEGKKKRKRRRKKSSETDVAPSVETKSEAPSQPADVALKPAADDRSLQAADLDDELPKGDPSTIAEVANFEFKPDGAIEKGFTGDESSSSSSSKPIDENAVPLPDIKQALRQKAMEMEVARIEAEEQAKKPKVNRRDKDAFAKLLEDQPYADSDLSLFEEDYGTISALLGEGAKKFIGIPSGPLQIGHFIGSLVILLMAFVEYPGFPLTNLPSPLRGALQGGLGTVYLINAVLAVLAVFKASERGQPALLWIAKTFSVGGLAYDQLTQLPTLKQIEAAEARKGKRALKNRRK